MKMFQKDLIAKVLKILKKTSQVEFILVRPQAYSIHTTDSFRKMFRNTSCLKRTFWKSSWCNSVLIKYRHPVHSRQLYQKQG